MEFNTQRHISWGSYNRLQVDFHGSYLFLELYYYEFNLKY